MLFYVILLVQFIFYLPSAWYIAVYFISLLKGKKTEVNQEQTDYRYAVLVCAHNEVNVIGQLVDSLQKQNYPKDKYRVIVIADNCTDGTQQVCAQKGCEVFDRITEKGASSKGAALKWGMKKLHVDYPNQFDIVCVFDADNLVDPKFLTCMNEGFCTGAHVVTGNRQSSNPFESIISRCYTVYWYMVTHMNAIPCSQLGLPVMITGTGFGFRLDAVENGVWETTTLSEDVEFYLQQLLAGKTSTVAPEAVFFDEQPRTIRVAVTQLRRWTTGINQIFVGYIKQWLTVFTKKPSVSLLDGFWRLVTPISMWLSAVGILLFDLYLLFVFPWLLPFTVLLQLLGFYFSAVFVAAFAVLQNKGSLRQFVKNIFAFPLLMLFMGLFSFLALLFPQKKWGKVEHGNQRDISQMRQFNEKK